MKQYLKNLAIAATSIILISATPNSKPEMPEQMSGWTRWITTTCFKGLDFRYRTNYIKSLNAYEGQIEFKNRYKKMMKVRFEVEPALKNFTREVYSAEIRAGGVKQSYLGMGARFTSSNLSVRIISAELDRNKLECGN
jgi:hypothetical protein